MRNTLTKITLALAIAISGMMLSNASKANCSDAAGDFSCSSPTGGNSDVGDSGSDTSGGSEG